MSMSPLKAMPGASGNSKVTPKCQLASGPNCGREQRLHTAQWNNKRMVFTGLFWLLKPISHQLKFEYIVPSPPWVVTGHCKLTQEICSTDSHSGQVECISLTEK